MAGTNGPTSAAGTPQTPNPESGTADKPDAGGDRAAPQEKPEDEASEDQNEDG